MQCNNYNQSKLFENKMEIYFTIEEWKDLQKYISKSKRKKFMSYFHKALSTRLQNQGLKC